MPWAALFPWLRVSSQQLAYVWPGPEAGTVLVGGTGSSGSAHPRWRTQVGHGVAIAGVSACRLALVGATGPLHAMVSVWSVAFRYGCVFWGTPPM